LIYELLPFVSKLERCRNASDVRGLAIDGAREVFGAHVIGCFQLDHALQEQVTRFGVRDADVDEYVRDWRPNDLLVRRVLERGMPSHNWQVYQENALPELYHHFGRRLHIYHTLVAPLFGARGTLMGSLIINRTARLNAFGLTDLSLAATFSGFLSATLARVSAEAEVPRDESVDYRLTPRELQIARLAAEGRNNLQIALQLGLARETVKQTLRRAFRKFDANGRAQMAAKLASSGLLHSGSD
jgi:DNA-binding CsgD family transcriptional regulator